ncbi:hypothetical protein [Cytobacillus massiliigabonensis]|uniref:hypothetical protein n=1 Tax=Cytobacillus massiliigabonensis TaxID=1871011 RepID=UPI000C83ACAD|nr:hypothetical protein [Cytobacillus massiliigabonensis]
MSNANENIISLLDNEEDISCQFFEDLVIFDEGEDEIYIGRTLINRFILVPKIAGYIINELRNGKTLSEVKTDLNSKDIEVDLEDFILSLLSINFVKKVGEHVIPSEEQEKKNGITFEFVKQKHVKWIFSIPAAIAYFIFVSIALFLLLSGKTGSIIPSYDEAFWHSSLLVVVLSLIVLDIVFNSFHELFHFFSTRAISGGLGFMSLGRRLTHLVFQTKIENIWVIPRKKRYIIYLSGMLFDIFLICIFTYIAFFQFETQGLLYHFSRFVILLLLIGLVFEFRFYMKTDLYYLISDYLKYPTLFEESYDLFKSLIKSRSTKGKYPKKVWIYGTFMVLGSIIDILITFNYIIPVVVSVFTNIKSSFESGTTGEIISNVLTITLIIVETALVIYFFVRDKYSKQEKSFSVSN